MVKRRLELPDELDGLQVLRIVNQKSTVVVGVDATRDDFDLESVLKRLKFEASDTVFLNWYRFDRIDELRTDDACRIFSDLFYPSSDDLDIFDLSANWLLSIEHNGFVSALRFPA